MKFPSKQEALYQTMHNANPLYRNHNQGISRLRQWLYQLKDPPASILEIGCGNGKLCELLLVGRGAKGVDECIGLRVSVKPWSERIALWSCLGSGGL